jgi:hypothetical protein
MARAITLGLETTLGQIAPPSARRDAGGPELARGTVVNGRYHIEALAGRGGMGIVYRARDASHPDRPLALKTIVRAATDTGRLARFKAEFQHMTRLRHPNVAEVYDFEPIQHGDDFFFTMEYVEGRDALAATEQSDWSDVVDILVQVCRALSYVHSRELIHFDLKPANILVSRAIASRGTSHRRTREDEMPRYVIERNTGVLTSEELEAVAKRSLEAISQMEGIVWIRSYISEEEGKIYCEYEAPNPEALREHARRADIPADRISAISLEVSPDMFR